MPRTLCAAIRLALLGAVLVPACTHGGVPAAGGPGPIAPRPRAPLPALPGLRSLAPGDGVLRVDWQPLAGGEAAIYLGASPVGLFTTSPALLGSAADHTTLRGLTNGAALYVGLGVRAPGAVAYTPAGPILRARIGPPIFVDAAADPAHADGLTPATAFADVPAAVLAAVAAGRSNLWLRAGRYAHGSIVLPPGIDLYGGFGAGFDLAARGDGGATVLASPAGLAVVTATGDSFVDGARVEATGGAPVGVDVVDSHAELRGVEVAGFADRGIRVRNGTAAVASVRVVGCDVRGNGADGLSAVGPLDLAIEASRFEANAQEGVEVDDLVSPGAGSAVTLAARGSSFSGNGQEGLDADLAAPALPGPIGGTFTVDVRGCLFADNGADGLLIDLEYELAGGWSSDVVVRESRARGNRGAGIHVDADALGAIWLHRVAANANGGDGVLVTSESHRGFALVTASAAAGNLGAGLHATAGNVALAASHCVVAGNRTGGIVSDVVDSTATSCLAWLQPFAWRGTLAEGSHALTSPADDAFENAAAAWTAVIAAAGARLELDPPLALPVGTTVELGDDGVALAVALATAGSVTLDRSPSLPPLPGVLAAFAGGSVDEDWRLTATSPWHGTGLARPGGVAVDPGPFGTPAPGAPGAVDPTATPLLRPLLFAPQPVLGSDPIVVAFSAPLDAATVPDRVRAFAGTAEIPLAVAVDGAALRVTPAAGWGPGQVTLHLYQGIRSTGGAPLAATASLSVPTP